MLVETLSEQMVKTIQYIKPTPFHAATGLTAQVYQQLLEDFIPAPLVALHSPVPEVLRGLEHSARITAGRASSTLS